MGYDALGAIKVLRDGLSPERPHTFVQADALVRFPSPCCSSHPLKRQMLTLAGVVCYLVGVRACVDIAGAEGVWGGGADVLEDDGVEFLVRPICSPSSSPHLSPHYTFWVQSDCFMVLSFGCLSLILYGVCRSHGTYYFIAAGCQWSLGQYDEAQKLLDAITGLLDKKKIGGKDLPTEVLIKKKRESPFLFSFTISTCV